MPAPPTTQIETPPLISMRGISKSFPGVKANDEIAFDIYRSEIHALLGENGAGKSTLMKILYGFYRADSGRIMLEDQPISIQSPHDARQAQIGMLFQDFTLIPAFSVAENIALFLPELDLVVDIDEVFRRIEDLSTRYGLQVDPHAMVSQLSIGEKQKVEILKLLLSKARLLILDEPTRVLAPHEVEALIQVLRNLREDGYAIVFITHKLREVLECADRVTVLRHGRVTGTLLREEATEERLVNLMFEQKISEVSIHERMEVDTASPALELEGVNTQPEGAETALKNIDLRIYPGEIVGVAGVSGNGQKELGDLILGIKRPSSGRKLIFDEDLTDASVQAIRKRGVCFIPEDPLRMASVPFMTVLENMSLTRTWHYDRWGGLGMDWDSVQEDFTASAENLQFSLPLFSTARSLSGGNLQRMVIVREMAHKSRLIIASYLTRGLDVQSTIAAQQALIQAREGGAGVLLVSEDLDELFLLSDRLIVLYDGRIVGSFKPQETNLHEVGHLMTGSEIQNAKYT